MFFIREESQYPFYTQPFLHPTLDSSAGEIPGVKQLRTTQPLNVEDVYELGRHAYREGKWAHAIQWLSTTLDKLGELFVRPMFKPILKGG